MSIRDINLLSVYFILYQSKLKYTRKLLLHSRCDMTSEYAIFAKCIQLLIYFL